jgi:hypothetical protein
MSTKPEQLYNRAIFNVYLKLDGPEGTFKPLFDYLAQLDAKRVSDDYPIWWFRGPVDARDGYLKQIGALLESIPVRNDHAGLVEVMWRVLLMGPNSHHGFGRGFSRPEFERLKKEGKF